MGAAALCHTPKLRRFRDEPVGRSLCDLESLSDVENKVEETLAPECRFLDKYSINSLAIHQKKRFGDCSLKDPWPARPPDRSCECEAEFRSVLFELAALNIVKTDRGGLTEEMRM